MGRFLQSDPIGGDDDINLYAYVGNDPLNQVDPKGLCSSIKDEAKRTDCLEKRATAVARAKDYIAGQPVRSDKDEGAYIETYNEDTGEVSVRTGDAAGHRTRDDVPFTDNEGNELAAREDGRIVEYGNDGSPSETNEIVLATGHVHPKRTGSDRIDSVNNANESIRSNRTDRELSRIAPAVIKTPSEKIKVIENKEDVTSKY